MIERLTKKQESLLKVYKDKWIAIGLNTNPANRVKAEEGIRSAYSSAQLKPPKIVWCLSPLTAGLTMYSVLNINSVRASVGASVGDSVRDSVWESVRASVGASVGDSVRDSVWDSVRNSVGASVKKSVRDSVWNSVRNSIGDSVRDSVWDSVWDSVRESVYGQHDANWLGFYDYCSNVLKLEKQTENLKGLWMVAQNANWFIPYENICWISERHNICKLNDNRVIHSEDGPAIAYPDGFEIYALNGVRTSKKIVMTPADKLDAKLILTEKNAEIRKEIVKKIGINRVLKDLKAKCIDRYYDYRLFVLDLGDGRQRPYLHMINPSTKEIHIEGVAPEIKTVKESLRWRRSGIEETPIVLT